MKLDRTRATLKPMSKSDDCFMPGSPAERLSAMWDITSEIWSLRGDADVKRRLQRNVARLVKK